jgi:hypothetical protein
MVRSIAVILSIASAGAALGQEAFSEVSDAQIAVYQRGMDAECKGIGGKRRVAPERARYCECVMMSLRTSMSREEWQQAIRFARKRDEQEMKVLEPHLARASLCRHGP